MERREFLPENGEQYPVHSNPLVGALRQDVKPCPPTCGTSQAVGDTSNVRHELGFQTLQDNHLDGSGVALAIVDSGIYQAAPRARVGRGTTICAADQPRCEPLVETAGISDAAGCASCRSRHDVRI